VEGFGVDLVSVCGEALTLLLPKHIHSEDVAERLAAIFCLLRATGEPTVLHLLETILRYLGAAAHTVTAEAFGKAVSFTFPETGEKYMDRLTEELTHHLLEQRVAKQRDYWTNVGKMEGMASFTIRLLLRRFQRLDRALENRVRQLSQEELEAPGVSLLEIPNEAGLAEWLDRRGKSH
jgi:hypothetical protein